MMTQSCKSLKNSASNAYSGTWILTSLNGELASDAFKQTIPTMTLDFSTKKIYGNSGCNRYTGAFSFEKDILSAPNVATTMMACFELNKESDFTQMIAGKNSLSLNNGVLTFSQNGRVVATFIKGIDTSTLFGEWVLESIAGEDMKALFPIASKYPSLQFDIADGRVSGNAGCNRYNGSYELKGTSIKVGPLMTTRMACENLTGENKFTQALEGENKISVNETVLVFSKDGKETLKFVKK